MKGLMMHTRTNPQTDNVSRYVAITTENQMNSKNAIQIKSWMKQ